MVGCLDWIHRCLPLNGRDGFDGADHWRQVVRIRVYDQTAQLTSLFTGQYHWVSEFSPKKHQKFLSYVVGEFVQAYHY